MVCIPQGTGQKSGLGAGDRTCLQMQILFYIQSMAEVSTAQHTWAALTQGRTLGEKCSLTTFQGVIPAAVLVGACPVSHPRSLCPPLRTSQYQAPPSSSKKTDFQVYADYSVGLLSFRQRENTLELFLPYKGYTKCHTLPQPTWCT